jgi:hypothetical protein
MVYAWRRGALLLFRLNARCHAKELCQTKALRHKLPERFRIAFNRLLTTRCSKHLIKKFACGLP